MSDEHKNRIGDKSYLQRFLDWKWTRFVQQVALTAFFPLILWGGPRIIDRYTYALDQNTMAINNLTREVEGKHAEFAQELKDHQARLDRDDERLDHMQNFVENFLGMRRR